ncbi:SsrA-binding protein, partial [Staphylococcus epidermidis]|uniref:SsrA-binding protein n=1 Tax=Staphylococcus epidermidis TaxID=1282 RepID=UPI0016433622
TFAQLTPPQIYLNNIHIPPYQQANPFNHHPLPTPKLLFHKKQIQKLPHPTPQIPYSIIPFNLYLKHPQSKLLLPL